MWPLSSRFDLSTIIFLDLSTFCTRQGKTDYKGEATVDFVPRAKATFSNLTIPLQLSFYETITFIAFKGNLLT
mgnify:CR=1 FL=1